MRIAHELLTRSPRPGHDYALTELVHCGSQNEIGVWDAIATCVPRYFERVMAASPALVIIVVGAVARDIVRTIHPDLAPSVQKVTKGVLGSRDRHLAFLPHPSGFGPKTAVSTIGAEALSVVQTALVDSKC